ncbi:CPBP family intramembrane glutamic endopeptidase [Microlunatus sp. Gsoil 973]|uniref:CPBP family intramembrane glutamic endopeptidase n=1 Tax=Microlunatus sp. Gsoil 973 TaxID=2672569 RepID=UPI0018A881EE|nr:CPBP family intramembrane glutamic endopeptidase [Microlunatus sp. Gsoil 973]
MTSTTVTGRPGGDEQFVRQRRKPAVPGRFTAVWLAATLLCSLALLRLQAATGFPSMDVLSIVMLAPAIAVPVAWAVSGRPAFLLTRAIPAVAFGRTLLVAAGFGLLSWLGMAVIAGRWGRLPDTVAGAPLVLMLLAQFIGALGEEIGYKGVLYSYLSLRLQLPLAMIIQGVIFGVIHLQYWSEGPTVIIWFFVGTVGLVAAIPAVWRGSLTQRVFVAGVMHFAVNIVGFSQSGNGSVQMMPFAVSIWCGALPLLIGWLWLQHRHRS